MVCGGQKTYHPSLEPHPENKKWVANRKQQSPEPRIYHQNQRKLLTKILSMIRHPVNHLPGKPQLKIATTMTTRPRKMIFLGKLTQKMTLEPSPPSSRQLTTSGWQKKGRNRLPGKERSIMTANQTGQSGEGWKLDEISRRLDFHLSWNVGALCKGERPSREH